MNIFFDVPGSAVPEQKSRVHKKHRVLPGGAQ